MKTEVIMRRELFGYEISQRSKSTMFSATDLIRAGNAYRLSKGLPAFNIQAWFNNQSTKEFIYELEKKYTEVKIGIRGRGKHTWVHPLLFIDLALAISPKLKIEVYEWLFDCLIKNRNDSGDSYKKMCGALYVHQGNKKEFSQLIASVAIEVQKVCRVDDWQSATEAQLKKRDQVHHDICLLANVMNNNKQAIRLGILQHQREAGTSSLDISG